MRAQTKQSHSAASTIGWMLQVTTYTSDFPDAGSDAHVSIDIRGSNNGSSTASGTFPLAHPVTSNGPSSSGQPFARGQRDSFVLRCWELGQLSELLVWHDSSGGDPSWHLAYIEVQHASTGQVGHVNLPSDAPAEGKPHHFQQPRQSECSVCDMPAQAWQGMLSTCCTTAGNGAISTASSGFKIQTLPAMTCRERCDLSESPSGAALHIIVCCEQVWFFSCDQWLDHKQGDAATRRLLKASDILVRPSRQCSYRVSVTTGNVRGAGTDANVFVIIHGSQGSSGQLVLGGADRWGMLWLPG
jgi:hypothetical protein